MLFGNARQVLIVLTLTLLLTLLAVPAAAQTPCDSHAGRLADLHTREQLKQFVQCAAAHVEAVGWEQAAQDFEGSDWMDGSIYLFAGKDNGDIFFVVGSGLAAGTNLWDLQDSDGVWSTRELLRVALNFDEGYVYYRVENPVTGQEEPKVSYVLRLDRDGEPAGIGAGYFPRDTHATCSPDAVRASLVYSDRDVERFVTCAAHHLQQKGLQALHDFASDPRWISGPNYLFFGDLETLYQIANPGQPHLVGTDGSLLVDADGVRIGLEIQRVLNTHDDGFVYYSFPNPATGEPGYKGSYVRRVLLNGRAYVLGAGLYIPSARCRDLPLARDVDTRDELQQYVRCAAQLIDERDELAWDLLLKHPQWIGGATYIFVLDDQCRQLVYPLDYERALDDEPRCHVTDAEGFPVNQEVHATTRSEVGEGWVDYVWLNPANGVVEAKHSYVIGGALHGDRMTGEHISIGAGLYESDMQQESG